MNRLIVLLALAVLLPAATLAEDATALTIYSSARAANARGYRDTQGLHLPGYGIVKQERNLQLVRGVGEQRFVDVAALIDPTTVRFESLTDPEGTRVLEQNYQFDLISQQKLIERYLDREITVEQLQGDHVESFTGTLLSAHGGLVLRNGSGELRAFSGYSGLRFPELPGGLITRPTLVWSVETATAGEHRTRISYETKGLTWWADYNLIFAPEKDANRGKLDVAAWVTIVNRSGAGYSDAGLKLVAGDVHRASSSRAIAAPQMMRADMAKESGFTEKSFFEYHLYTLGRSTTLPDNSTKQIELFDAARGLPVEKILVYDGQAGSGRYAQGLRTDRSFGTQSNSKVNVYLSFENSERNGLGIPLPAGRVRVSQLDPDDGSLEFIGEDAIDHTPRNETLRVALGSAFDVVGERKQTEFVSDQARRTMHETIEVELRNHKEEAVEVLIVEYAGRSTNWEILESSHEPKRIDSRTLHFPVQIEAGGKVRLRYRVRYSW